MNYVYAALGLGVLFVAFGIFIEKKKTLMSDSADRKSSEQSSAQNSYVYRKVPGSH